jgi:ATP-dependent DNA ligase
MVAAALRNRNSSFVIDGEAVLLGVDGVSDFNGLHSRQRDDEVEFYGDGDDLRKLPLSMRKTNLQRLLARRADGIHTGPCEQGEIGPDLFRHACLMGLEGLVSKHRDSPYRGGRFDRWVKVKNRRHPFSRVMDALRAELRSGDIYPVPRGWPLLPSANVVLNICRRSSRTDVASAGWKWL